MSASQKDTSSSQLDVEDQCISPGGGEAPMRYPGSKTPPKRPRRDALALTFSSVFTSHGFGLASPWIRNDASDTVLCKSFCSKLRSSINTLQQFVAVPSSKGTQAFLVKPLQLCRSLVKWKSEKVAVLTFSPGILMIKKHQFPESWWTRQILHLNRNLHDDGIVSTMK